MLAFHNMDLTYFDPLIKAGISLQNLYIYTIISAIKGFILTAFGVYAGILLWLKKSSGIKMIKIYLIIVSVVAIILTTWLLLQLSEVNIAVRFLGSVMVAILGLASNLIWFFYFIYSERVKNTYIQQ